MYLKLRNRTTWWKIWLHEVLVMPQLHSIFNYFDKPLLLWKIPNVSKAKKINPMSQSCREHLFFGARLIQQNSRFEFFLLAWFFFPVFYDLLIKKYKKRYDRHNETLWTTNFFNSCVLPCILFIKNQVPYFKAVTDSNLTRLLLRKKQTNKKQNVKKNRI